MFKVVDLASFNDVLDLYAEPQVKNREGGSLCQAPLLVNPPKQKDGKG